jgi:hypothetical protein
MLRRQINSDIPFLIFFVQFIKKQMVSGIAGLEMDTKGNSG